MSAVVDRASAHPQNNCQLLFNTIDTVLFTTHMSLAEVILPITVAGEAPPHVPVVLDGTPHHITSCRYMWVIGARFMVLVTDWTAAVALGGLCLG